MGVPKKNSLDGVFLIIIGASSLYGLIKGFIRAGASILGVILWLVLASQLYTDVSLFFREFGLGGQAANIVSFILLFIVIFLGITLVGILIHKFVHAIVLGWINRLAGPAFEFVKGLMISSIIIIILTIVLSERAVIFSESKFCPYIMHISKVILSLAPEDVRKRFLDQEKRWREFWEKRSIPEPNSLQPQKA